jgi:iron(III) transport system substrate-binding protein
MRNRRGSSRRGAALLSLVAVLALVAAACGGEDEQSSDTTTAPEDEAELVVYSGRDEELVAPLIEQFEEETGITTEVRYGNSAEMGAALLEEGENTPADVFYSQEVGAIGVLDDADLLAPLPQEVVDRVGERYRPAEGTNWVGVTGRSRVIVINPDVVAEAPTSIDDLTDPKYQGQVAWAPENASFQSFITAFRVAQGDEAASQWLDDMIANDTQTYGSNVDILEAVNNGDIGMGLINHYYWARMANEVGGAENMDAQLIFLQGEDPGALVNATAVAVTATGAENPASFEFVDFLLSQEGQTYFVEETLEYPMIEGVDDPAGLPALEELAGPQIDLTDLASLEASIALLTDKGLLG